MLFSTVNTMNMPKEVIAGFDFKYSTFQWCISPMNIIILI